MHAFVHHNSLPILKRHTLHLCLFVGSETKPCRFWPPRERNLHFHISTPHSDSDTYCSLYKMMVIVKMNMMIARVMAALVVVMSMMMIMICYFCQWQCWVFTGKERHSRYAGYIRLTVGVQASSSRIGEITLSGMNVIGPQSSTQRPPTVSRLHCEGQQRRIQKLQAIYWRMFGGKCVYRLVYIWNEDLVLV